MMDFFTSIYDLITKVIYWDSSNNKILLANLAIAIALFTSLRLFSGAIANISPKKELITKDNPAFGISMAGVVMAVTIVLTGAIYGDPIYNLEESIISVGFYGILSVVLMAVTRIIFDKFALTKISIRDEIVAGNVAAGIIDAGNVIASAIVIRAVMVWVDTSSFEGAKAVVICYVISQFILTLAAYLHARMFSLYNENKSIQEVFKEGNAAVALRFAGRRIGVAFAITAASTIMIYEIYPIFQILIGWTFVSIIMIVVAGLLSFIAQQIVLFKIDVNDEVVNQKNIALGIIQAVIYIAVAMLLAQLVD